jgi:hypothetical protein
MAGLDPAIPVFFPLIERLWTLGTRPGVTIPVQLQDQKDTGRKSYGV